MRTGTSMTTIRHLQLLAATGHWKIPFNLCMSHASEAMMVVVLSIDPSRCSGV